VPIPGTDGETATLGLDDLINRSRAYYEQVNQLMIEFHTFPVPGCSFRVSANQSLKVPLADRHPFFGEVEAIIFNHVCILGTLCCLFEEVTRSY
jgi:hypothetical protein